MPTQAQKVLVFNFPGKMSVHHRPRGCWSNHVGGGNHGWLNIRVPDVKYSLLLNHSLFKAKKLKSSVWNENLAFYLKFLWPFFQAPSALGSPWRHSITVRTEPGTKQDLRSSKARTAKGVWRLGDIPPRKNLKSRNLLRSFQYFS